MVENKVDLLDDGALEDAELQEFAKNGEFCGCFRTSAKTGTNIAESMEFLIKTIIKRMEDMASKGNEEVFTTERKSVALDPEKHSPQAAAKRKKDSGGCC